MVALILGMILTIGCVSVVMALRSASVMPAAIETIGLSILAGTTLEPLPLKMTPMTPLMGMVEATVREDIL